MEKTDYRKLMAKEYLGVWDIPENSDLTVTIASIKKETIKTAHGDDDVMMIRFSDFDRPWICNVTNAKTIKKVANSRFIEDWVGVRIALYVDDNVKFKGEIVEGVRVREYAPKLPEKIICADCGKEITAHGKYSAKSIAESSRGQFGRTLCFECAGKAKEAQEAAAKASDIL